MVRAGVPRAGSAGSSARGTEGDIGVGHPCFGEGGGCPVLKDRNGDIWGKARAAERSGSVGELAESPGSSQHLRGARVGSGELAAPLVKKLPRCRQTRRCSFQPRREGDTCGNQPRFIRSGRSRASSAPGQLCSGKGAEQKGRSLIKTGTAPASP